jgi:hypothetical protein
VSAENVLTRLAGTTFFAAYLLVGVLVAAGSLIFGIFVHLITLLIGFILLLMCDSFVGAEISP